MKKLFTILLLLVAFISVKAADILVNSSGLAGSYTTISAAVQAASPGDRILISPQIMPYQEDSLVINKDLTLMPYATNSFVSFEGRMYLTLDSIADFTIIGFRGNQFDALQSVFNDTSINSLSVVNIVDCEIEAIRLDQPKTSLYLSYSEVRYLAFSHGDIIGSRITGNIFFGLFDYSQVVSGGNTCSEYGSNAWRCEAWMPKYYWETSGNPNYLNGTNEITECELFENAVSFGNVDVYSDTCNFIANWFDGNAMICFSQDFPFNFRNNRFDNKPVIYLAAETAKGINEIVNNYLESTYLHLAYCPQGNLFNFSDVTINVLNNENHNSMKIYAPNTSPNTSDYAALPINSQGIFAWNSSSGFSTQSSASSANVGGVGEALFDVGLTYNLSSNDYRSNPSLAHLNLDLTPNIPGLHGGSHAWSNYHGSVQVQAEATLQDVIEATFQANYNASDYYNFTNTNTDESYMQAGRMSTGTKARITYLNLPTQIFDPANIRVKAKAVHGN
jgi:hypothetical protein